MADGWLQNFEVLDRDVEVCETRMGHCKRVLKERTIREHKTQRWDIQLGGGGRGIRVSGELQ